MDDNRALSPADDAEWKTQWLLDHPQPDTESLHDAWVNGWTNAHTAEGQNRCINRQCSIGYHDECSDPRGDECRCQCHTTTSQTGNESQAIGEQPADRAPITVNDANDVLAVCGHSGRFSTPGGFRTALVNAMIHADPSNLALLGLGFPGLAAAVWVYKNELGGVDRLAGIVAVGISRD